MNEGEIMVENIIGAAVAFLLGAAIAYLNFHLSKNMLKKSPEKYAVSTVWRQGIQVLYLVAVFIIAEKLPLNSFYPLLGAALGITIPGFYFTSRLLKFNSEIAKQKTESEDDANG
ncbi:MAG: hypothetical protein E7550_05255 [Ruminococcaceae bacterium]|nr:hypothetical protein [Oscillospiraceae bacterium]